MLTAARAEHQVPIDGASKCCLQHLPLLWRSGVVMHQRANTPLAAQQNVQSDNNERDEDPRAPLQASGLVMGKRSCGRNTESTGARAGRIPTGLA